MPAQNTHQHVSFTHVTTLYPHPHIPPLSLVPTIACLTQQVSAHGTGAAIPPVDETVVAMKLITPAQGLLELSKVGVCVCVFVLLVRSSCAVVDACVWLP